MNQRYYDALGLVRWESQHAPMNQTDESYCHSCKLPHLSSEKTVAVGNPAAAFMIVIESPGFYEATPEVDRTYTLFTAMLQCIHYSRNDIYMLHLLVCEKPNQADLTLLKKEDYLSSVNEHIALVQPKLVLAVGNMATHLLLNMSLEKARGNVHQFGDLKTSVISMHHPLHLLENTADKRLAFTDLKFAERVLQTV